MTTTFSDLPLRKETIDALHLHGFTAPFAIQEMVLPIALADGDVIGQAKTGTGKTLAFGIPLIERVIAPNDSDWQAFEHKGTPQVLVVVPTRELCVQVAKDIDELANNRGIRTLAVYGGRAFEPQIESLNAGIEIVVGTPGRLLDLYRQGQLKLKEVSRLVLDVTSPAPSARAPRSANWWRSWPHSSMAMRKQRAHSGPPVCSRNCSRPRPRSSLPRRTLRG